MSGSKLDVLGQQIPIQTALAATKLLEGAVMLEILMTKFGDDFKMESKDIAATMLADEMVKRFKEGLEIARKDQSVTLTRV